MRKIPGRIGLVLLSVLAGGLLAGCSTLPQSPLDPRGPVAQSQTGLLMYTLWVALGIGIFVTVALLYVVFRFRARPGQTEVPKQVHGNHTLEVIWTVIPILVLVSVAYPTVEAAFETATPPEGSMVIKAEGNQWWFGFTYPAEGFVTANEMRIPVGKPVKIELTSRDVIHSFWIPKLAGKMDMIPNRTNVMWLKADEPGLYYGQCAEFCGDAHAKMRFRVIAMEEKEYTAWVEQRKAMLAGPKNLDSVAARGQALFEKEAGCFACHAVDGTKAKGNVGPNLTDIGQRKTLAAGIMDNTYENMKAWISDPRAFKPGSSMPAHKDRLKGEDLDAVIKYLESLK
ncbi:MAG: cytochrome c oxidase subunit II [Bacillota bacterium]